jgi:hypothetical protein
VPMGLAGQRSVLRNPSRPVTNHLTSVPTPDGLAADCSDEELVPVFPLSMIQRAIHGPEAHATSGHQRARTDTSTAPLTRRTGRTAPKIDLFQTEAPVLLQFAGDDVRYAVKAPLRAVAVSRHAGQAARLVFIHSLRPVPEPNPCADAVAPGVID